MSAASFGAGMTPAEAIEAFVRAAHDGDLAKAPAILREGKVDVNARSSNGGTALLFASNKGHLEFVRYLLENGADLDLALDRDSVGWTALHAASQEGHFKVCRLLLAMGANVNAKDKDQETPLHRAAFAGHLEICRELVKAGADVEAKDCDGWTPLMLAAEKGHAAVCECLVKEAKANVNAVNNRGETALRRASLKGHLDICRLLIERGADVRRQNSNRRTALHKAAERAHAEVCKFLLDHGAEEDLFVFSKFGDRPLDLARRKAKSEAIYLFLLDRMVLLCGHDEADREAQNEASRDFFSSALQSFLAPSFDPLPVRRSLIQWLRFSPVAARMQEEWPPTAHNWQSLNTKAKRLVAYREDAWERRKHLICARDYDLDGLDRPAKSSRLDEDSESEDDEDGDDDNNDYDEEGRNDNDSKE